MIDLLIFTLHIFFILRTFNLILWYRNGDVLPREKWLIFFIYFWFIKNSFMKFFLNLIFFFFLVLRFFLFLSLTILFDFSHRFSDLMWDIFIIFQLCNRSPHYLFHPLIMFFIFLCLSEHHVFDNQTFNKTTLFAKLHHP